MEYRPFADELAAETRCVQELHRLLAAELDLVSGRSTAALSARHRWGAVRPLGARRRGPPLVGAGRRSSAPPAPGSASAGSTAPTARPLYVGRIGLTDPGRRDTRAARLAGARGPAVLLRDAGHADGSDPATPFPARRDRAGRAGRRHPRRRLRREPRRHRYRAHRGRPGAAGRAVGAARLGDARHRHHDPGRAGRGDPAAAGGRRRDRGRPGHREDRGRAAPRRLPALHPPRAAGPPRRAGGRPERPVPRVRRGRAARRSGSRPSCSPRPARLPHGVDATAVDARRGRPAEGRPGRCARAAQGGRGRADPARRADPIALDAVTRGGRPDGGDAGPAGAPATAGARTTRRAWCSPRTSSCSSSSAASS